MTPLPRTHLPPRLLPVLYFAAAHVALALAFGVVAVDPRGVSGFFYNARMLGIVHLITHGWITASILGSLYIIAPIALRTWIPATWLDYTAFVLVLIGIVGMVAHFWIQDYAGMAWSAGTVAFGILAVGVHVVRCLDTAALPRAVSAHIVLAFVNILGAATTGVLIGFDKVYHFLPGFVLANVFAHAHLAGIGWASMMVVGVAYRLLPMVLPAAMPHGRRLWVSRRDRPAAAALSQRVGTLRDPVAARAAHVDLRAHRRRRVWFIHLAGGLDAAPSASSASWIASA